MVLDRRGFMKFMAGASAGVMATPLPWKLLDDVSIWTQNWSWIPANVRGENSFVNAVSKTCPSGVALRVRLVGNRPVRVLPQPEHPLGGGVSALAVAELQMLHSPARVKKPFKKAPDGGFTQIEWKEAWDMLVAGLKRAGGNTAYVCGDETGSTVEVMSALASKAGGKVFFMPSEAQSAAKACELAGLNGRLGYDFENADYVLAIGANLLETWGTAVRNRRIFAESHPHSVRNDKGENKASAVFAYAGPVRNNSAAVARPWLPILPGTEAVLALGIANMLIAAGRSSDLADFADFKALAAKYTPEETAKLTGVPAKLLAETVEGLLKAKAPLAVVGSEFNQGGGALPILAGIALNSLLGNINKPGGLTVLPYTQPVLAGAQSAAGVYKNDFAAYMAGKERPAAIVLHEANPLYALPNPAGAAAALKEVPFKVAFASFMDETASQCDLILPIGMGLERIDDVDTPYGSGKSIYCITLPASAPTQDSRNTGNVLIQAAKALGFDLGVAMYEDLLKAKAQMLGGSFDALAAGEPLVREETADASGARLRADLLAKAPAPEAKGLRLAVYSKLNLGSAVTGIPPYNTKTIRAQELSGKDMYAMMNAATAAKQGLQDGMKITLQAGGRAVPARLRVFEGVMNDTAAVCLGFGHTAFDEFSKNKGANVMELLNASSEPETGLSVWAQTGVAVAKA